MLLMAVVLSSAYLWPTEPAWLKDLLAGVVVLTVVWLLAEQKKLASVGGTLAAPLVAPPSRLRVILIALFVLAALAIPPLYYWLRK